MLCTAHACFSMPSMSQERSMSSSCLQRPQGSIPSSLEDVAGCQGSNTTPVAGEAEAACSAAECWVSARAVACQHKPKQARRVLWNPVLFSIICNAQPSRLAKCDAGCWAGQLLSWRAQLVGRASERLTCVTTAAQGVSSSRRGLSCRPCWGLHGAW
jgi:hypothetical protein